MLAGGKREDLKEKSVNNQKTIRIQLQPHDSQVFKGQLPLSGSTS